MRQLLGFVLLMAAAALGITRYMDHAVKPGGSNAMAMVPRPGARCRAAGVLELPHRDLERTTAAASRSRRGSTAASIDFIVDTGASTIALRETAAAKLGIHPTPRDYTVKMQTANGVGKAARVQLDRIEINGITVRDVAALVIPDDSRWR